MGKQKHRARQRQGTGGPALKSRARPLLSLCMIVRDSAQTLPACLKSIRPWVDEMVIVDTGSRDNTREIAAGYGARVFEFPWCDDFSAARNESLARAGGKWLFWMDSDDTIDGEGGQKLRRLAQGTHDPDVLGYVVKVRCPGGDNQGVEDFTVVDHVKLFRNHSEVRFEFRIHEQLLPSIRRLGGSVRWSDVYVAHSGADTTAAGRQKKYERDPRILEKELRDRPEHPFALFNVGMTYADRGRHEEAVAALTRSLAHSDPSDSHVRKAYALLVSSLSGQGRMQEAWEACQRGLTFFPSDAELLFRQGLLAHDRGDLNVARRALQDVIGQRDGEHFASIDQGIVGYKACHNLALVYGDLDRPDLAELQWREVIAQQPSYRPAWRCLGQTLLQQSRLTTAAVEAERMMAHESLRCEGLVLTAAVARASGDHAAARRHLEAAVAAYPDEDEPLEALCQLMFACFSPEEAVRPLLEKIRRDPSNGAAHHNLGTIHARLGDSRAAAAAFRDSVRVRPDAAHTWEQLAGALEAVGNTDDAQAARNEAARYRQARDGG